MIERSLHGSLTRLKRESVDLLHIDGLHTYEAVKEEL